MYCFNSRSKTQTIVTNLLIQAHNKLSVKYTMWLIQTSAVYWWNTSVTRLFCKSHQPEMMSVYKRHRLPHSIIEWNQQKRNLSVTMQFILFFNAKCSKWMVAGEPKWKPIVHWDGGSVYKGAVEQQVNWTAVRTSFFWREWLRLATYSANLHDRFILLQLQYN